MIRVYRQFVEKAFLVALYMNGRGYGLRDAREYANYNWPRPRNGPPDGPYPAALKFLDREPLLGSIEEHIEEGATILNAPDVNVDRDLVDTIVRIIGLPYARMLSGNVVEALQRAILTPDELAGLREQANNLECLCRRCGHKFASGEMTTFHKEGNSISFYCTNCLKPDRIRCSKCDESAPLGKALSAAINKGTHICDAHKEKPVEPNAPQAEAAGEILDWARAMEARPVAAAPVPPPPVIGRRIR